MKTVLSWDLDFCSYKSIFVFLLLLNVEVLQWRSFIGCFSLSNSHLKWTLIVWEKRIVSKKFVCNINYNSENLPFYDYWKMI